MNPIIQFLRNQIEPFSEGSEKIDAVDKDIEKLISLFIDHSKYVTQAGQLKIHPQIQKNQIWTVKSEYDDFQGMSQKTSHPFLVLINSEQEEIEDENFTRVFIVSPFIEMATQSDEISNDPSIIGFPFLIETWNDQPMLTELLNEYIGYYESKSNSFSKTEVFAQAQLHGYVTEQNSGKNPVQNVLVKSLFANEIMSNSNGEFVLVYQNTALGANVFVTASKENWVVVNEKEMSLNLPENPKENKLKIVMCPEAALQARKKEYYEINDRYITQAYEKKLKAIDRQKSGWEKQVAELQEELQGLQKQLVDIADEYSKTNLDDLTEKERHAYQLYKDGKIDESRRLRESFESEKNYSKSLGERKKIEKDKSRLDSIDKGKIEEVSFHKRNLNQLANEAQLRFDFAEADRKLEFLALSDSSDFDNLFGYAFYLSNQNNHNAAIWWYNKALLHVNKEDVKSSVLNNLGILYKDMNNYPEAEKAYLEALEIRRKLAKSNPSNYEPDVAMTQYNLGILYSVKNNYPEAEKAYLEALVIYRRLVSSNPSTYEPDVAMILNKLGALNQARNNYPEAEKAYLEALEKYRSFYGKDPNANKTNYLYTVLLLGYLYKVYGSKSHIEIYFPRLTEIIEIMRILPEEDEMRKYYSL